MEPAQEFQWCVPARLLEHWPELFGIFEVINVFGKTGLAEIFLSLTLLAVWLTICLAWGIFPSTFQPFTGTPAPASRSHLRTLTMLLVAVTSIFFLVLTTGLNKVVVVFAALHNYFEWLILGYVYIHFADAFQWLHPEKDQRLINWQRIATWWIFSVILVILAIPDILEAFAFEEVVGLWPDFQLAVFALICWRSCRNPARECHRNFALAAVFHLLQIFILLGQGMGLVSPFPTGQLLIMFLAFANYAFLVRFALLHDEAVQAGVDLSINNRRLPRIEILMILCLCLSASSVLGPPLMLGDCVHTVTEPTEMYWSFTQITCQEPNGCSKQLQMDLVRHSSRLSDIEGNKASRAFFKEGEALLISKWDMGSLVPALPATGFSEVASSTWRQVEALVSSAEPVFPSMPKAHMLTSNESLCPSVTKTGYVRLRPRASFWHAVQIKMASMIPVARGALANFYLNFMSPGTDELLVIEQWKDQQALHEHLRQIRVLRLGVFAQFMTETYTIQGGYFELVPCTDMQSAGAEVPPVSQDVTRQAFGAILLLAGGAFLRRMCLRRRIPVERLAALVSFGLHSVIELLAGVAVLFHGYPGDLAPGLRAADVRHRRFHAACLLGLASVGLCSVVSELNPAWPRTNARLTALSLFLMHAISMLAQLPDPEFVNSLTGRSGWRNLFNIHMYQSISFLALALQSQRASLFVGILGWVDFLMPGVLNMMLWLADSPEL